jgi:hypothetical protein
MTPLERARHATDAAVRAAWNARRPEPYAEDGITVERALDEAGADVFARFSCADPALWLVAEGDALIVVGMVDDGPASVPFDAGPEIDGLRAAAGRVIEVLTTAAAPRDPTAREAATKAEHALGFALDDARRRPKQTATFDVAES